MPSLHFKKPQWESILKTLDLHGEVIKAFVEGAEIQYRQEGCDWSDANTPAFELTTQYRVKPPKPALEIPWYLLPKDFKYAATDAHGGVYLFRLKPKKSSVLWVGAGATELPLLNLNPRNVSWVESLTIRPGVGDD